MKLADTIRIGHHATWGSRAINESASGGGGGPAVSDHTLRMSHIAAGRPYIVLLAPADADTDAARRLHLHTFSDPAA